MPDQTEIQLLLKLLESTRRKQIDWSPTAQELQFSGSVAGKYTLLVQKNPFTNLVWLTVKNVDGDELVSLNNQSDERVDQLYDLAKRQVLKIDEQVADLMKELDLGAQADKARLIEKIRNRQTPGEGEKK